VVSEQMLEIQQKIADRFDCVEDWFADPELGFKVLPISGYFVRSVAFDEFIARVKAMLPADVKLMIYDGWVIRMGMSNDTYQMIYGSKTWPRVPEGERVPTLEPLFLGEATGDPVGDLRVIYVPEGIECRLIFNKQTHMLAVPKEEETEERCVVAIRPKQ